MAAFSAMLVARVDFPIEGRAASTIRLPGWKPPVRSSRSEKPEGVPVRPTSLRESSSSLSISSWRTASIARISLDAGVVADLEERLLGALDQLPGLAAVGQHLGLDLAGGGEDPAHQRVVAHDAGVVQDRAHRGHDRGQRVHVGLAARLLELALAAQVVADGERVHGLGLRLLLEADHRPEDPRVARAVEVTGLQPDLEQHSVQRLLGEQDGAQDRGLGLLVVGRNASRGLRRDRDRHRGAMPAV